MREALEIHNKYVLTLEEAAKYFHIGEKKLRKITEEYNHADFFFMNGNRVLIKKKKFEEFIDRATEV